MTAYSERPIHDAETARRLSTRLDQAALKERRIRSVGGLRLRDTEQAAIVRAMHDGPAVMLQVKDSAILWEGRARLRSTGGSASTRGETW
jgi:hypothetical protein